jgi:hypothetical protein
MKLSSGSFATALAALVLLPAAPVRALDIHVTHYDDHTPGSCEPTDCTLREAVLLAHSIAVDRIVLAAGTYTVNRVISGLDEDAGAADDLDIAVDVEIVGAGASMTEIRTSAFRVFQVSGAATQVKLTDVAIVSNVLNPEVPLDGHSLLIEGGATVTLERCEVRDGVITAPGAFAAITALGSSLVMRDSTIAGNDRDGVQLQSSSVGDFVNVTFAGNGVTQLQVRGGSDAVCANCTFVGDAVRVSNSGSTVALANTGVDGFCTTASGGLIGSQGGNREAPAATCGFTLSSDEDGLASLGLGALGNNGGTTRTLMPGAGTPLIDAALDPSCPAADQRGAPRPGTHGSCDSGAVERQAAAPTTPLFVDDFEQGDAEAWDLISPAV